MTDDRWEGSEAQMYHELSKAQPPADTMPYTATALAVRSLLQALFPLANAVSEAEENLGVSAVDQATLHNLGWAIVEPVTRWAAGYTPTDIYGDEEKAVHVALDALAVAIGWERPAHD